MLSFCPYGDVSRGTACRTDRYDESVRVVLLKHSQLSFNAIHASNQHCSDKIITGEHRLAHDGQTRLTIICYFIRENNIAESSVLFWKPVFEEPTLIEHYRVSVIHIQILTNAPDHRCDRRVPSPHNPMCANH